jgi:hypothetical protein
MAKGRAARKPENLKEALAWLHTIAEHVEESFKAYKAHKPPMPAMPPMPVTDDALKFYLAAVVQRAQWLSDMRRLWWFVCEVKDYSSPENEKRFGRLLGLERGPGSPRGRKTGKSLDLNREISEQRETKSATRRTKQGKPARTRWKEVGRDHGMSDQAARKRQKRALPYLAEEDAKEFAARLKQHFEQKPPQVGTAKARSAAMAKKLRAQNRRKR